MVGWIALGVGVLLLVWLATTYNRLVGLRNKVSEAWSGIEVQLTRRADLVPNLISTVQGYIRHERGVLTEVTEARTAVMSARNAREAGVADDRLEAALGRLYLVAEAYPDLKASTNFTELQRELSSLEEEISFARRFYNAVAEKLNTAIQRVPTVFVAGPLGFRQAEFFKASPSKLDVPSVQFE
jgi:LemA protein